VSDVKLKRKIPKTMTKMK